MMQRRNVQNYNLYLKAKKQFKRECKREQKFLGESSENPFKV
jgi:hypothetical protein